MEGADDSARREFRAGAWTFWRLDFVANFIANFVGLDWLNRAILFTSGGTDVFTSMRWFNALPAGAELSSRLHRQVDKTGTSIVLNIAERNGRYPEGECQRFLDIAFNCWDASR
jgi:hypothetical protein